MKKDFDLLLRLAADSNEIIKDDKLAKLIDSEIDSEVYAPIELSEIELEEVFAAAKPPDFEALKFMLNDMKNRED